MTAIRNQRQYIIHPSHVGSAPKAPKSERRNRYLRSGGGVLTFCPTTDSGGRPWQQRGVPACRPGSFAGYLNAKPRKRCFLDMFPTQNHSCFRFTYRSLSFNLTWSSGRPFVSYPFRQPQNSVISFQH